MKRGLRFKGFTLIELLIVVAIIGILAALAIPALTEALDRAKQRATVGDMRSWGNALGAYYSEKGTLPIQDPSINVVRSQVVPFAVTTLRSRDHWEHDFVYYSAASYPADDYTLKSLGKDNIECPDPSDNSPCLVNPLAVTTWRIYENDMWLVDGLFTHAPG